MPHRIEHKIVSAEDIESIAAGWRARGMSTVFTNGVFDILHRGHVDYLFKTSLKADKLIIGVNSDASARRLNKGDGRPFNKQDDRAYLLAALEFTAAVVIFDEDTPYELIRLIEPDVLIKGGDYDPQAKKGDKRYIVGSDILAVYGGLVEVIPFLEGYSTSSLVEKIRNTGK